MNATGFVLVSLFVIAFAVAAYLVVKVGVGLLIGAKPG